MIDKSGFPTVGRHNAPMTPAGAGLVQPKINDRAKLEALVGSSNSDDDEVLKIKFRIIMFRDMQIDSVALVRWVCPDIPASTYKFILIYKSATRLQGQLQSKMWTNKDMVKKIMDIGIEYSGIGHDSLPAFRNEDADTKIAAFTNAFGPDLLQLILKPLAQVFDVKEALSQEVWSDMYEAIFVTVAMSIWDTIDWAAWAKNPNKLVYKSKEVYENMRAAVEYYQPVRPGYDEVPVVTKTQAALAKTKVT